MGFFAAAALAIALIGANPPPWLLFAQVFVAGATSIGTQILLYASVAQLYTLSGTRGGPGLGLGVAGSAPSPGRPSGACCWPGECRRVRIS